MVYFCCVHGCKAEWYPGCGSSFHRIPKDEFLSKKWKEIIPGKVNKTSVVCKSHFKEEDFVNKFKKRLKNNAVPSIFPKGPGPSQSAVAQDFGDGSERTITDHEDIKAEVKAEPVSGDEENSAEGSFKELQSPLRANYTSTYPQTLYTQPTTSTTPFIKIEVDNYKEDFLKLQQEVATLKAENQSLNARNHYLAQEIFKLKQTSHVLREHDAIKDTHSIDNDLSHLAKESNRLSEKISEYADKIQKITSKYEIHEKTMDIDRNALENLDLTDKLRRLIEENKNIIGERDELKDKVQSLLVDLKNVSEENKTLTRYVKMQRKRIEMLRILCVSKTKNLKRLEKSCFKLKSMFSKLKMARQDF